MINSELGAQTNWEYFHKLLENPKIMQMNQLEVCKFIYEATFMKYSIKFYEELYLREKYEKKIIELRTELDKALDEIKELKGEHVSEEGTDEDQGDTKLLGNDQGSGVDQGIA